MKQISKSSYQPPSQIMVSSPVRIQKQYQKQEPDLYVILQNKIYPLHSTYMKQSQYISSRIDQNQKVLILNSQIEIFAFEKVIKFLRSSKFQFERDAKIEKILDVCKLLEIPRLQQILFKDFQQNFEEYSIFILYKLAVAYNRQQLLKRCKQQLLDLEYHQININRSSLYQLDPQLFQEIIRDHQKFKLSKIISGIGNNQILQIIEEYCSYNNVEIDMQELIKIDENDFGIESVSLKTPLNREKMTFSNMKVEIKSNKSAQLSKSCAGIQLDKSQQIKQKLLLGLKNDCKNFKIVVKQISESMEQNGIKTENNDFSIRRQLLKSYEDSAISQAGSPCGQRVKHSFSNMGSSGSMGEREMSQIQEISTNKEMNSENKDIGSRQVNTAPSENSICTESLMMLKIPQFQKNIFF